jgi:GNAT superfamily N-acetyltransferase
MNIVQLEGNEGWVWLPELVALLQDAVQDGASIGFVQVPAQAEAESYWNGVFEAVQNGSKLIWVARTENRVVGTVQLGLESRANGLHRAEVMKLLVHTSARRQGVGRALLERLEIKARSLGRTTLVLDTREGDPSNALYTTLGWVLVGAIPRYVTNPDGSCAATMVYYKLL